jgi:hypothetical protein
MIDMTRKQTIAAFFSYLFKKNVSWINALSFTVSLFLYLSLPLPPKTDQAYGNAANRSNISFAVL